MSLLTYHPFKALYALLAVLLESARFPFWILRYILRSGRPNPHWTLQQAIRVRIVRAWLFHVSQIEIYTPPSLRSGLEWRRFAVMQPAKTALYAAKPVADRSIKPGVVGGTWYPKALLKAPGHPESLRVLLNFHGGAFVIGDGRELDSGFTCRTLIKQCGYDYALSPQYRLSSNRKGRFPAALQDAITSYAYLLHNLRIPANRITLSGDSAGANLVLALLRYIAEHGDSIGLPRPAGALLWSPWLNIRDAQSAGRIFESENYDTDYLNSSFALWGARSYAEGLDASNPYLSPYGHPFATPVPLFIQTGSAEVLHDDHIDYERDMAAVEGNKVQLDSVPYAPHDIALVGNILGFDKQFVASAKKAAAFLKKNNAL